jgi:hypothetical protein
MVAAVDIHLLVAGRQIYWLQHASGIFCVLKLMHQLAGGAGQSAQALMVIMKQAQASDDSSSTRSMSNSMMNQFNAEPIQAPAYRQPPPPAAAAPCQAAQQRYTMSYVLKTG